MTTPIRPPSPRALENSAGIHRSPSFRVPVAFSPLYEAMRRDEYLQRVREKQFGHVFRNEVRMPKKP